MRLTTYTDYTLRTLIYVAMNGNRLSTIAGISQAYGISEAHLMKVVHQLGAAGDIETMRGRNGGIRLARSAAAINLGTVVRRTETDMDLVPCFEDAAICTISGVCVLRSILNEALTAFLAVLDRHSLVDLLTPRAGLATLLGVQPTVAPASGPYSGPASG